MASQDLSDLRVYQLAMELGESVWAIVDGWAYFPKQAMGLQLVRAADSVAANISEGFGRYSFKENARFCYYARGSLRETATWIEKAHHRKFVDVAQNQKLLETIQSLRRQLDGYIRSIGRIAPSESRVREESSDCNIEDLPSLEEFLIRLETA